MVKVGTISPNIKLVPGEISSPGRILRGLAENMKKFKISQKTLKMCF